MFFFFSLLVGHITTAPPTAGPSCNGQFEYVNHLGCVLLISLKKSWTSAREHCKSIHADLFSLADERYFEDFKNYIKGKNLAYGNYLTDCLNFSFSIVFFFFFELIPVT